MRIISGISTLLNLIEPLCGLCHSQVTYWMVLWTTILPTSLWTAIGPCHGFQGIYGLLGFSHGTLWDNGPPPQVFYGFCGFYRPFTIGIPRVKPAIGPLGHPTAYLSILRLLASFLALDDLWVEARSSKLVANCACAPAPSL